METDTVHPRNFLGLELNPRAAAIAELVLWLGYLQWQMRNKASISDPVLEKLSNITPMDAVLKHDPERPKADGSGTELPNPRRPERSEEHTSELQSLMRSSYAVFCLKKKKPKNP